MTGKIIKGIAGFYYVHDGVSKVYECKAKGVFRNRKIKPLVGDNVEFDVLSEEQSLGNIVEILPRENSLMESIGMPDMMSICPVLWRGKGSRRSMTS